MVYVKYPSFGNSLMPRITENLLRKRCEHNDNEIGTLEELSLHQEDIEKLELLQYWCKDLKILLLHSNLISKIENLGKLKHLEYINFSLNNIERIENLEGCESLNKLDFTLNFIGELTSVESLKKNIYLETLYLNGNPCADYPGYRDYVIATLPQLKYLDGYEVLPSDRIKASQKYESVRRVILQEQKKYSEKRAHQKLKNKDKVRNNYDDLTEEQAQKYWSEINDYSPESKIETAYFARKCREKKEPKDKDLAVKRVVQLFTKDGRPLNVNEPKVPFRLDESDEDNSYILDVSVYRYLDTNLLSVDVQPNYVKIIIKNKVLQLYLFEEVSPDKSTAQRSQTTGHLVITMPKVNGVVKPKTAKSIVKEKLDMRRISDDNKNRRELLEVGEMNGKNVDFTWDVEMHQVNMNPEEYFIDAPEVPALE